MCLTFCQVREVLYDSDTDDVCGVCGHNRPEDRQCATCRHRERGQCQLTHAPLPAQGWCCHYGVLPACGWRRLSDADVRGPIRFEGWPRVLNLYDVDYRATSGSGEGHEVDLASLALPLTYGIPTVHWDEEAVRRPEDKLQFEDVQLGPTEFRFVL